MQYQKINKNTYVLRIVRGEEVTESLKKFCAKLKISNAFFYGLGALDRILLADYNVDTKKYLDESFSGAFELTNITGNVMDSKAGIIIHSHASLSDDKMHSFGGHFVEGRVSGTVEIYLTKLDSKIIKVYDKETGLKLMKLKEELK